MGWQGVMEGSGRRGQTRGVGGSQLAGVSGRGMDVEGALPPSSASPCTPLAVLLGSRAPWGSPATPTRGCPSWPCHPELEPCPSGYPHPRAVQGTRLGEWGAPRQPRPCLRVTSPCPRGDLWGTGQGRCPENLMVPKGQGFWRRGREAPRVPFLQPWGRARLKTKPREGP